MTIDTQLDLKQTEKFFKVIRDCLDRLEAVRLAELRKADFLSKQSEAEHAALQNGGGLATELDLGGGVATFESVLTEEYSSKLADEAVSRRDPGAPEPQKDDFLDEMFGLPSENTSNTKTSAANLDMFESMPNGNELDLFSTSQPKSTTSKPKINNINDMFGSLSTSKPSSNSSRRSQKSQQRSKSRQTSSNNTQSGDIFGDFMSAGTPAKTSKSGGSYGLAQPSTHSANTFSGMNSYQKPKQTADAFSGLLQQQSSSSGYGLNNQPQYGAHSQYGGQPQSTGQPMYGGQPPMYGGQPPMYGGQPQYGQMEQPAMGQFPIRNQQPNNIQLGPPPGVETRGRKKKDDLFDFGVLK